MEQKAKHDRSVLLPVLHGIRVEYEWKYDGKAIVYYLIFSDYALAVYGYGVDDEVIDSVVGSIEVFPRGQ